MAGIGYVGGVTTSGAISRLLVVISGQTGGLQSALNAASGSLVNFQTGASRIGGTLTRTMTVPLGLLGGAAIKMSIDFDQAMARVAALTNATAEQVARGEQRIFALTERLPVSATELADSLYFAASAGLDFNTAMEIAELSAGGAAIGMGRAADVSKVLIFALNAYGPAALSAREAMDALTAAIKEGTAEPEDFAIALGRLLPIASEVGISFQEVVAQIAALTNIGLPARVAVTGLRALLTQLVAPTQKAKDNLAALGITVKEIRDALEAGPLVAFEMLYDAVNGNQEALQAIIPQLRGMTAFLGVAGDRAAASARIMNNVRNSTGAFDRALRIMSRTAGFQARVALEQLRNAAIELGRELRPAFLGAADALSGIARWFREMPEWGKNVVAIGVLLGALAGPILRVYGAVNAAQTGFVALASKTLVFAAAAAVAITSFENLTSGSISLVSVLTTGIATFVAAQFAVRALNTALAAGALGTSALANSLFSMTTKAGPVALGVTAIVTAIALMVGVLNRAERSANATRDALANMGPTAILTSRALADIAKAGGSATVDSLERMARAARQFGRPLSEALPEIRRQLTATVASLVRHQDVIDKLNPRYAEFAQELARVGSQGRDLLNLFNQAGIGAGDFALELEEATFAAGRNGAGVREIIEEYVHLSRAFALAERDLRETTRAQILASRIGQSNIQALAQETGTSVEFMTEQVRKFGADAAGLTGPAKDEFLKLAGLIDESTGDIIAAQEELIAKTAEFNAQISESLASAFDPFAEVPEKFELTFKQLRRRMDANLRIFARFGASLQQLIAQGFDPEFVGFLAEQGAEAVNAFMEGSERQQRRIQAQWQRAMGLIEAGVVTEEGTLQGLGASAVEMFVTGMHRAVDVPAQALGRIITRAVRFFAMGQIDRAGLDFMQRWANAISLNANIPDRAVQDLVVGLMNRMRRGFDVEAATSFQITRLVRDIGKAAGLSADEVDAAVRIMLDLLGKVPAGSPYTATIDAQTSQAESNLRRFRGALDAVEAGVYTAKVEAGGVQAVNVSANTGPAEAAITRVRNLITQLAGRPYTATLDADERPAMNSLDLVVENVGRWNLKTFTARLLADPIDALRDMALIFTEIQKIAKTHTIRFHIESNPRGDYRQAIREIEAIGTAADAITGTHNVAFHASRRAVLSPAFAGAGGGGGPSVVIPAELRVVNWEEGRMVFEASAADMVTSQRRYEAARGRMSRRSG